MTVDKNEVILSLPDGEGSENQLWTLGTMFKNGYFTLRNPKSGGYLTATSETSTSAEGNITSAEILFDFLKRDINWAIWLKFCSHFVSNF